MKRSHLPTGALVGALLFLANGLHAQESEFWYPYTLGNTSLAVPSPNGTNTLSGFLPENGGGYVAIWDDGDGAFVERRDNLGTQLWLWRPPEPRPDSQEVTRALLANQSHVLWCSAQRWFYLALTNGAIVRSNDWSLPYLDANKLVPQNDLLYVLYGNNASVYDTNMERQATVSLDWPAGYWRAHAGAWLLDLSTRTNRTLRLARIGDGLVIQGTQELTLPASRTGGYTEHRVLGADPNGIFVASSLSWPDQTTYYFSHLTSAGTVSFRHQLVANQIITGAAVLPNGWLLSAQFLGEAAPRHTLYRVDRYGRPHWQVEVAASAALQTVVLNTSPPRVLRFNNGTPSELRSLRTGTWFDGLWENVVIPSISWDEAATDISGIVGSTSLFWLEPIRMNAI